MQDPENLKLGTVHNLYKLYFLGGEGVGVGFRGVIKTQLFLLSISIYEFLHIFFDRGFLVRTGVDCTVGGVCVCACFVCLMWL